jgi:hypothetical protein
MLAHAPLQHREQYAHDFLFAKLALFHDVQLFSRFELRSQNYNILLPSHFQGARQAWLSSIAGTNGSRQQVL